MELWGEAIACAVYTLNRVSTKTAPNTPYQNWFGTKPDVSNLRIFGSTAYIHVPKAERMKLDSKSITCSFVGYCTIQKTCRFWDQTSRKIRISKDVIFNEWATATLREDSPPANNPAADNVHDLITNRPNDVHAFMQPKLNIIIQEIIHAASGINNFPDLLIYPNRSELHQHQSPIPENPNSGPATNILQVNQPDQIHHNPIAPTTTENDVNLEAPPTRIRHSKYPLRHREPKRQWDKSLQLTVAETSEPQTNMDAMNTPNCQEWKKSIQEEYDSLLNNHTWTLTPLPTDQFSVIKSGLVLKLKPGVGGAEPRYKARLVAKGYSQRFGIDYEETLTQSPSRTR